jgi:hypothetical protein
MGVAVMEGNVTHIWGFGRCEEPGCGKLAWYRLFSRDNEFSYFVCLAHMNQNHCPFEIHGLMTCLFTRKQLHGGD